MKVCLKKPRLRCGAIPTLSLNLEKNSKDNEFLRSTIQSNFNVNNLQVSRILNLKNILYNKIA